MNCWVPPRPPTRTGHPKGGAATPPTFTILRKSCPGGTFTVLRQKQVTFTVPPPYAL